MDTTGESPIEFYDMSWLAVHGDATAEDIIAALGLSDPMPVTWRQGLNAVRGDFWDFDAPPEAYLSRVFITPVVAGWRLAIGGWVGGHDQQRPGRDVAGYCQQLSRAFGAANAFTSQGRMDWYGWCLARSGVVYRHFLWQEATIEDSGTPTPAEVASRTGCHKPDWRPDEELVMAIAGETSISPLGMGTLASTGMGCLARTDWGRKNGVPARSLDQDAGPLP